MVAAIAPSKKLDVHRRNPGGFAGPDQVVTNFVLYSSDAVEHGRDRTEPRLRRCEPGRAGPSKQKGRPPPRSVCSVGTATPPSWRRSRPRSRQRGDPVAVALPRRVITWETPPAMTMTMRNTRPIAPEESTSTMALIGLMFMTGASRGPGHRRQSASITELSSTWRSSMIRPNCTMGTSPRRMNCPGPRRRAFLAQHRTTSMPQTHPSLIMGEGTCASVVLADNPSTPPGRVAHTAQRPLAQACPPI